MRPWMENLIKAATRGILTWVTVAWTWEKFRKQLRDVRGQASDAFRSLTGNLQEPPPGVMKKRIQQARRAAATLPATGLKKVGTLREGIMEKKKSWSFFKVILILGIVVAVAIYLLDRILPKPYRDEDLDEAWEGEDDLESEEPVVERPMAAEAVAEHEDEPDEKLSSNGTGEEEKPKKSRKSSSKKGDTE